MNYILLKRIFAGLCCLVVLGPAIIYAQNNNNGGILEISEILLPQGERLKHQKNLYYEVYTSRTQPSTPSYWYKISFIKDCAFKFTLFPIYEEDTYDIHCFKVSPDMDICTAIAKEKLISCITQKMYKDYNDDEVRRKEDAGFIEFKEIQVKAGDAVYIEIFSTRGKDCGHIMECNANSSFFVIKLINRKCPTQEMYSTDKTIPTKQYQAIGNDNEAIAFLNNTFCAIKPNELAVMAIKMNEAKPSIVSGLDFVSYSQKINADSTTIVADEIRQIVPESNEPSKSTADLEESESLSSVEGASKYSRLDIDKVLFTSLIIDFKEQITYNNNLIKTYNAKAKKIKSPSEREAIVASSKELKQENISLQEKSKEARIKLKNIHQAIIANKKGG